jgi:hypothetical protein
MLDGVLGSGIRQDLHILDEISMLKGKSLYLEIKQNNLLKI